MRPDLTLAMMGDPEDYPKQETRQPILVTHEDMLCEVRFWTEAEWDALPLGEQPRESTHKPGSGWIGLVPATGIRIP